MRAARRAGQARPVGRDIDVAEDEYPQGLDCYWIGCDANGQVAVFVTAGIAPIPSLLLRDGKISLIGDQLDGYQPEISGVRKVVTFPNPDAFVDLAAKGLFVYDWIDASGNDLDQYVLVAIPDVPTRFDDLPEELAAVGAAIRFPDVRFDVSLKLNPRAYFESVGGS